MEQVEKAKQMLTPPCDEEVDVSKEGVMSLEYVLIVRPSREMGIRVVERATDPTVDLISGKDELLVERSS